MTMIDNQLDRFLEKNLNDYIQETAQLCAQPSISARKEGVLECAELVRQILERHGLQVQKFETPGSPVIAGHATGESERTLLFYNHYDVQPPEPLALWTTPPFEPTVRDGALYARGAMDDKGQFIARLAALDSVRHAHGGKLPCNVTFVVEGEEEVGSPHIAQFVRDHTDLLACQAAIWEEGGTDPEGYPTTTLGCRGILYVELMAETLKMDAHSGGAHHLPNAAWRLVQALMSLKERDGKIAISGFYDDAHPPSAQDIALLDALPNTEAWLRENFGVKDFVGGLSGNDFKRAVFNPTCNIAGLTAGHQGEGMKTVIPARATAKVDFRLVPDQDPDDIFAKLRAHLDQEGFTDVNITRLGAMWPYKASADDPFVRLAALTAEDVYSRAYRTAPLAGGSTPIYAFAAPLGNIPVISAGVGNSNNRAHSPDEYVRLDDFLNGSRHIARILDDFANLPG
ncbi:MAG TPA: M20/M25/M40 family metallo-hydrolase [Anaerolineales bacterium]|nr:M20/M25/M40 family metallo-hydrolase [Anaerolineales bacterium]